MKNDLIFHHRQGLLRAELVPAPTRHEVILTGPDLHEMLKIVGAREAVLELLNMSIRTWEDAKGKPGMIVHQHLKITPAPDPTNSSEQWRFRPRSIQHSKDGGLFWTEKLLNHKEQSGEWLIPVDLFQQWKRECEAERGADLELKNGA